MPNNARKGGLAPILVSLWLMCGPRRTDCQVVPWITCNEPHPGKACEFWSNPSAVNEYDDHKQDPTRWEPDHAQ